MAREEKLRKRLLFDLSPIPEPPVNKDVAGDLETEVRVVYQKKTLTDVNVVKKNFTIGTNFKADVSVDEAFIDDDLFDFITYTNGQATVNLKNNFKGFVIDNNEKTELQKLGKSSIEIHDKNAVVVEFGAISLVVVKSPKEKLPYASPLKSMDSTLGVIFLATAIIGFIFMNMIIETPPIEVDIFEVDNRFAKLIVEAPEEEVQVKEPEKEKKVKLEKPKEGIVEASQQRKSLGDEGRVGNKNSRIGNAQGSARRGLDDKVAQSSGVMGALSSGAASFDRVFGGGGLGAGMEKTLGGVTGISGVDQFGSGGLGTRGFGTGGGGNALGIGGLGTRGRGGGGGVGSYGMAAGKIGAKGRSDISAGGGQAVIMGALDKAVIDAYIKRNLAKIVWCYEKELNKDPKLFGKIVVNFIIAKDGSVSSSKVGRTTMGNNNVESCVAGQIQKIRFPAPKGGGIVIVNYPFVFKNSEGEG